MNELIKKKHLELFPIDPDAHNLDETVSALVADYLGKDPARLALSLYASLEDANFHSENRMIVPVFRTLGIQPKSRIPSGNSGEDKGETDEFARAVDKEHATVWTDPASQDKDETLGILVSKWTSWGGERILYIYILAFQLSGCEQAANALRQLFANSQLCGEDYQINGEDSPKL